MSASETASIIACFKYTISKLKYLYPAEADSPAESRRRLSDFILRDASARNVEQLNYFLFGAHGSSLEAQLQLLSLLNHLPMDSRLIVAKLAINLWEIEQDRGSIINPAQAPPDIDLLRKAVIKMHTAILDGRSVYSTAGE